MAEHERTSRKNQEKADQRHRVRQQDSQPVFDHFHAWEQGTLLIGETPFLPRMDEHAELISRIPFAKQRHDFILQLQQTYGNRYVQRLIESRAVQAKLTVSAPNDIYEQEADRVARAVTRADKAKVQRQPEEEEMLQGKATQVQRQVEEEEEPLQTKLAPEIRRQEEEEELQGKAVGSQPTTVPENLETRIKAARGGGHPLSDNAREPMERAFGTDFSGVRVHNDSEADTLNQQLSAKAFTTGKDMFFRENEYSPGSDSGRELIAHELTHVVQQVGRQRQHQKDEEVAPATINAAPTEAIQAKPTDFKDERSRLEGKGLKPVGFFHSYFRNILEGLDEYKVVNENLIPERHQKLSELETNVKNWKDGYIERRKKGKIQTGDNAKFAELNAGGELAVKLNAERNEINTARGTLKIPSGQKVEQPGEPELTKKEGGKGELTQDTTLYFDAQLSKSSGLKVPSGTSCDILGDFAAEGSYLVKVQSPEQGKMTVWVPQSVVKVTEAKKMVPAIPKTVPKVTTPPKEKEVEKTKLWHQQIPEYIPIFPHEPSIADVQQGGLGDCYLLAAVLTVVKQHPEKIKDMMKDEGKTVTVRLFDVKPGIPKSFTPKFIRLNKSIVMAEYTFKKKGVVTRISRGTAYARDSLWVQLLEKAYAAAGFTGLGTALIGGKPSYGEIATGFVSVALEHLLGEEGEISMEAMQTGVGVNPAFIPAGISRLPWSDTEKQAYNAAKETGVDKTQAYLGLVSHEILKDTDKVDTWMTFVGKVNIEQKVRAIASKGSTDYKKAEIRLEDFGKLFNDNGLDQGIAEAMLHWLEEKRLYPGKRGTGKYTVNQLELFQKIRGTIKSGGYLALGSKGEVGRTSAGTGYSAGESKVKGLVAGHAYAVLGYKPDKDTKDLAPGELLWVELRNPWGKYGRQYEKQKGGSLKVRQVKKGSVVDVEQTEKLHETQGGIFWLELSDLTKRFAWIESVRGH